MRNNVIELVPLIIEQFARAENPDAAFATFDRFLAGLRSGGLFLPLLRQNPELIRFIALILGVAPRFADILAQSPNLIDPLIEPSSSARCPTKHSSKPSLRAGFTKRRATKTCSMPSACSARSICS